MQQLEQNDEKIQLLFNQYFSLQDELDTLKIKIESGSKQSTENLQKAFAQIFESQKVSHSVKDLFFDQTKTPSQLNLFSFINSPVLLRWNDYVIAVFSGCILVFDSDGLFLSVAKSDALVFFAKEIAEVVTFINETCDHKFISDDSHCISRGTNNTTYRYTCKDGSKDRRYAYNPSTTKRTDKREYGSIKIEFLNQQKMLYFSNSKAVATLKASFKK